MEKGSPLKFIVVTPVDAVGSRRKWFTRTQRAAARTWHDACHHTTQCALVGTLLLAIGLHAEVQMKAAVRIAFRGNSRRVFMETSEIVQVGVGTTRAQLNNSCICCKSTRTKRLPSSSMQQTRPRLSETTTTQNYCRDQPARCH